MGMATDHGNQTLDSLLSAKRDVEAAKPLFRKALATTHGERPCAIMVDRNRHTLVHHAAVREQ